MKKIFENWSKFLTEEQSVFTIQLLVRAQPGTKLYGRIFEAIRGIEGVTVIRSARKIEKDNDGNKLMLLSIRYYVNPAVMPTYVDNLRKVISRLKDADGDEIIDVRTFKNPEKMDDVFT